MDNFFNHEPILKNYFKKNKALIVQNEPKSLTIFRENALRKFLNDGFPNTTNEKWKDTDISTKINNNINFEIKPETSIDIIKNTLKCNVPENNLLQIYSLNGWSFFNNNQLLNNDSSIIIDSINNAKTKHLDLFEKYFTKISNFNKNPIVALNTAFYTDGLFVYIPENTTLHLPLQFINIINGNKSPFVNSRNLIIIGENSKLKLINCDDSTDNYQSFGTSTSEFFIDKNGVLDFVRMQNKNDNSTLVTTNHFLLSENATLKSNTIFLNGGLIRNETYVDFKGIRSIADIFGLYLADREQHIDNYVFVNHDKPYCTSNELFKGILDDNSKGVFNGHVLVKKGAQKTNAFQNNKNILISDKALIHTKPFLEIYADDVKCSHGATIGQIDMEALFYLQQRGISFESAQTLLLYAFVSEIINKIEFNELREQLDDLVKKRLRGELSNCEQCVLHCKNKEMITNYDIDLSTI